MAGIGRERVRRFLKPSQTLAETVVPDAQAKVNQFIAGPSVFIENASNDAIVIHRTDEYANELIEKCYSIVILPAYSLQSPASKPTASYLTSHKPRPIML